MSNITTTNAYEKALIEGDLKGLTPEQRLSYYKSVCESVKLNPLTKPFEYIQLNGKLTLYAKRDATDQLRKIHKVSIKIAEVKTINDVYLVIAEAKDKEGREDSSTGAVNIKGLSGEALANAFMKAETKAKRRVTLSVCGLGLLDESEIESIKDAKPFVEGQIEPKTVTQAIEPKAVHSSPQAQEQAQEAHPSDYVVTFGKFKGMALKDIQGFEIDGYIQYLEKGAEASGRALTNGPLAFVTNAKMHLEILSDTMSQSEERMEF